MTPGRSVLASFTEQEATGFLQERQLWSHFTQEEGNVRARRQTRAYLGAALVGVVPRGLSAASAAPGAPDLCSVQVC